MTRTRVLHFLNSPDKPGGVEEHVFGLMAELPADRFDLTLVSPGACYDFFAPLEAPHRRIVRLDLYKLSQLGAMLELGRLLRRHRIQVAHTHQFLATFYLAPIATVCGVPWIVETTHVREAWRRGWLKRSYIVDRGIYTMVDRFIAVSRANQDYLVEQKRCDPARVVQIYPGRDMDRFTADGVSGAAVRARFGIGPAAPLLVHVARLAEQKGHRYLFDALPQVRLHVPDVKVLLVGDGELRESLAADVRAHGLDDAVIFAGFQTGVAAFLEAADLVVLPSLFEGLPHAPIEAGALGKAIVAATVDGVPEVVLDGETGMLVPPADSEALGDAIVALLRDEPKRRAMGAAAQRFVTENFTVRRQVGRHVELYESLTTGANAGRLPVSARA